jgi:exportin-1
MHETHDGVQDMACDTFIKIAQKCRRQFIQMQVGEAMPFIEEILTSINSIISGQGTDQVHTFYEAVGYMISAQSDQVVQEHLIEKYMMLPNQVWDEIIYQASRNVDILKDPDVVKQLANILKTNVRACKALGHPFVTQLGRIYLDMLNVYKVMSENISAAITLNPGTTYVFVMSVANCAPSANTDHIMVISVIGGGTTYEELQYGSAPTVGDVVV